jgi:hypothetical protein
MSPRLNLQLPVRFSVTRLGQDLFTALTVNISRSGVLVESAGVCPGLELGDVIQLQIDLPVVQLLPARCIACDGRVVRLEVADTRIRVALSITTMQFQDARLADLFAGRQMSAFCM